MERHVKEGLDHMRQALTELEASARKLQNQNFADIVQSAHRRVTQLSEHPDLEAVHEQLKADHGGLEGAEDGKPAEFPFADPANAHGFVSPQSDGA